MSVETLPEYLIPHPGERGDSMGIDFPTYRSLAKTALAISRDGQLTMGLYRLSEGGCALDIFGGERCLTIVIEDQLSLFVSPMDTARGVVCLLQAENSEKTWRKLLRIAKEEISQE